ncbi:MAG TPA: hypothetical protein VNU44_07005 [Bryobacteraceae bacterium]|jgi:hypothetical protein|nr:hypothetical protein [Bryobacteraceae bacterium]
MLLRIKQARNKVDGLRMALLGSSPEEILEALPGLEEAVHYMETVEQEIRLGACAPYEVRRQLKLFKNDLRINARLIAHGVEFCQGWAKMLGAGPAYTPEGHAAPPEQLATLSLRG